MSDTDVNASASVLRSAIQRSLWDDTGPLALCVCDAAVVALAGWSPPTHPLPLVGALIHAARAAPNDGVQRAAVVALAALHTFQQAGRGDVQLLDAPQLMTAPADLAALPLEGAALDLANALRDGVVLDLCRKEGDGAVVRMLRQVLNGRSAPGEQSDVETVNEPPPPLIFYKDGWVCGSANQRHSDPDATEGVAAFCGRVASLKAIPAGGEPADRSAGSRLRGATGRSHWNRDATANIWHYAGKIIDRTEKAMPSEATALS